MAGITLAQAEAKLAEYLAAETKVLNGQKVEIEGEALTRANLEQIQNGIDVWDRRVKQLSGTASGLGRARTVRPCW
jgi:LDH2 family malate/lactate/ureidoglycolate dehydrogenase